MEHYDRLDERIARIQASSTPATRSATQVAERLDRAFITPVDREDIHELARRMDDVLDRIQETAEALQHLRHHRPHRGGPPAGRHPGRAGPESLRRRSRKLEGMKGLDAAPASGPRARERGRRPLPSGHRRASSATASDALEVIKWRDVYQSLEESIDAAEDVAEIIARMVHKNS